MALTRSMLKGMNLTEEQVGAIIDAHTETVNALKEQRDEYKVDAEKLPKVQKELDDMKGGKDWKAEFDKEHKAFEDYKSDVANRDALAAKKRQYRAILDELKINKDDADLIMAGTDFGAMTLGNDGKLADADGLKNTAGEKYKRYIPTVDTKGANVDNPPKDQGGNGANPRAAEIARKFHERRYGAAPADGANNNN